jgi:hypothetical protein
MVDDIGQGIVLEPRRQAVAFDILHHYIGAPGVFKHVIDADDVGMFEHGRGAGIAQQPVAQKFPLLRLFHGRSTVFTATWRFNIGSEAR